MNASLVYHALHMAIREASKFLIKIQDLFLIKTLRKLKMTNNLIKEVHKNLLTSHFLTKV